jgi:hypothetical protein
MVYIFVKGKAKTLKEISSEYNVSLKLIQGRYTYGIRDLKELIQPKHEMLRKGDF